MNREKLKRVRMIKTSDMDKKLEELFWRAESFIYAKSSDKPNDFSNKLLKDLKDYREQASAPKQPRVNKKVLGLFGVVSRFSSKELENVLRKVKKVKIKDDLKNILKLATGESYEGKEDKDFLNRYTGKEVNVYEWCGDWWICEDDNYVITENCFSEL